MSGDFVGIDITGTSFDTDGNLLIQYDLYLCDPAYHNEEEITEAFEEALTNSDSFATANTIFTNTFDLRKCEYVHVFVNNFASHRDCMFAGLLHDLFLTLLERSNDRNTGVDLRVVFIFCLRGKP